MDKALELAQKSAKAGCVYGYFQMGIIYDQKRKYTMAFQNYLKAEYNLGYLYFTGEKGIPKNRRASLYWYKRAAKHGSEDAESALREHKNEFR